LPTRSGAAAGAAAGLSRRTPIDDGCVPLPETQVVNAPSGLEEECEAMQGNRPDAIPHQIQGSIVADIDVVGGEEVCAKIEQWEEHYRRDDNHHDGRAAAIFRLTFHVSIVAGGEGRFSERSQRLGRAEL